MREDITDLVNIDLTIRNLSFVHMTKKKKKETFIHRRCSCPYSSGLSVGKDGGLVVRLVRRLSGERGNCDAT